MAAKKDKEAVEWHERFLDTSVGGAHHWQQSDHVIQLETPGVDAQPSAG
jgi:hypothetical protein